MTDPSLPPWAVSCCVHQSRMSSLFKVSKTHTMQFKILSPTFYSIPTVPLIRRSSVPFLSHRMSGVCGKWTRIEILTPRRCCSCLLVLLSPHCYNQEMELSGGDGCHHIGLNISSRVCSPFSWRWFDRWWAAKDGNAAVTHLRTPNSAHASNHCSFNTLCPLEPMKSDH